MCIAPLVRIFYCVQLIEIYILTGFTYVLVYYAHILVQTRFYTSSTLIIKYTVVYCNHYKVCNC